jgi:hypothetical protein
VLCRSGNPLRMPAERLHPHVRYWCVLRVLLPWSPGPTAARGFQRCAVHAPASGTSGSNDKTSRELGRSMHRSLPRTSG